MGNSRGFRLACAVASDVEEPRGDLFHVALIVMCSDSNFFFLVFVKFLMVYFFNKMAGVPSGVTSVSSLVSVLTSRHDEYFARCCWDWVLITD